MITRANTGSLDRSFFQKISGKYGEIPNSIKLTSNVLKKRIDKKTSFLKLVYLLPYLTLKREIYQFFKTTEKYPPSRNVPKAVFPIELTSHLILEISEGGFHGKGCIQGEKNIKDMNHLEYSLLNNVKMVLNKKLALNKKIALNDYFSLLRYDKSVNVTGKSYSPFLTQTVLRDSNVYAAFNDIFENSAYWLRQRNIFSTFAPLSYFMPSKNFNISSKDDKPMEYQYKTLKQGNFTILNYSKSLKSKDMEEYGTIWNMKNRNISKRIQKLHTTSYNNQQKSIKKDKKRLEINYLLFHPSLIKIEEDFQGKDIKDVNYSGVNNSGSLLIDTETVIDEYTNFIPETFNISPNKYSESIFVGIPFKTLINHYFKFLGLKNHFLISKNLELYGANKQRELINYLTESAGKFSKNNWNNHIKIVNLQNKVQFNNKYPIKIFKDVLPILESTISSLCTSIFYRISNKNVETIYNNYSKKFSLNSRSFYSFNKIKMLEIRNYTSRISNFDLNKKTYSNTAKTENGLFYKNYPEIKHLKSKTKTLEGEKITKRVKKKPEYQHDETHYPTINIESIANTVYSLIERKIKIEKERRGLYG